MHKFNEDLLQFIWRNKLLMPLPLITHSGIEIFILNYGELNLDSGPDFFNAQIRVNDVVLVGNIEIHIKTSDWLKHKHQHDKSYDNIILHVVYEHDVDLPQNLANNVEVLELKNRIEEKTFINYAQLSNAKTKLPCAKNLKDINTLKLIAWMDRMCVERLQTKVTHIEEIFVNNKGDYTQTFYTLLLRNFGFKVNSLPFELLAKQLPIQLLLKHADNLIQLEALLLGTAGFLREQFEHKHIQNLQNEFEYLKTKYQLTPLTKELFKFSKMRPANFPTLRLAQLAQLIYNNKTIFLNPHDIKSYADIITALTLEPSGYWKNHYRMDGKETNMDLSFGKSSAENLIINSFAPFFFFYARKTGKETYADLAINLLNDCKEEMNAKTKLFEIQKQNLRTAASTQAIINLVDNYCSKKRCLQCGIGTEILRA